MDSDKHLAPCDGCTYCGTIPDKSKTVPDTNAKQEYPTTTIRGKILHDAENCICGHRVGDYGTPEDNFQRIADLWTAYLGYEITPLEVATMMVLLKIGRTRSGKKAPTPDCYVDMAGYAACAGEIAYRLSEGEGEA